MSTFGKANRLLKNEDSETRKPKPPQGPLGAEAVRRFLMSGNTDAIRSIQQQQHKRLLASSNSNNNTVRSSSGTKTTDHQRQVTYDPRGQRVEAPSLIAFDQAVVSLKGMEINGPVAVSLCSALAISDQVREIDLSSNKIGDIGADAIASMLTTNPNIVALNLSKNEISPWGAVRLVRGCRKFNSVQSLNLSGNNVGDSGLSELGKWIVSKDCILRELVLNDSEIGFEATVGFARTMLENYSLLYLSVPHYLGFSLIEELQKLLQRNWAIFHKLDQQVEIANTVVDRLRHQTEMRSEKWNSHQAKREEDDGRTKFIGGTMEEWSDPDTGSTLMYLNVLERKSQLASESATPNSLVSSSGRNSSSLAGSLNSGRRHISASKTASGRLPPITPRRR